MIKEIGIVQGIQKTMDKAYKLNGDLEKVVLTNKDYHRLTSEMSKLRGWIPPLTVNFGNALQTKYKIFGATLDIGPKSEVIYIKKPNTLSINEYSANPNDIIDVSRAPSGGFHFTPYGIPLIHTDIGIPQIMIKTRANLFRTLNKNEWVALDTLREMISESDFRKYIKHGFILVMGKSGDTYQVFRHKSHTKVWRNGTLIEEICVRIRDSKVPMTDNVIAFKTIIEADEGSFKSLGNVYKLDKSSLVYA